MPLDSRAQLQEDTRKAELAKMAMKRVDRATLDLNRHKSRISACYRYGLPWRHGFDQTQPVDNLDDIYDDTLMTTLEDFSSEMLNTFTPMKSEWCEAGPVSGLEKEIGRQVTDQVGFTMKTIFAEMARSNVYQALQESYLDLGIGTMAPMIQDIDIAGPIHCEAIPMTELLIDRGPYGYVDGRFRKKRRRADDIKVLWPNASPPNGIDWSVPDVEFDVIDGLWRDWSHKGDELYQYVVLADGKVIFEQQYRGHGSCPIIVARWSRDSTTAWGVGPTYRSMPSYQSLNHVRFLLLKKLDEITDPAFSFENDGVANFDNGLEPGTAVPRAIGSKAPEVIESKGRFDVTWMQAEDLKSAVQRAHYQDRPDQMGKTPPTATQWADESAERQRRMGTPATNLVIELQYSIIYRFAYLLQKRGVLQPLVINNGPNGEPVNYPPLDPRFVALTPTSPLLRAQEQEELIRIVRSVETTAQLYGPQIAAITTDIFKVQEMICKILGTEGVARAQKDAEAAIKLILPALQAGGGGAGAPLDPSTLVGPNG